MPLLEHQQSVSFVRLIRHWEWGIGNWELAVRSLEVSSRCVVGNLLPNERRTDPKGRRKTHRGIGNRQEGTSPHPFTPSPLHPFTSPAPLPLCSWCSPALQSGWLLALGQFGGGAIATPRPPDCTALALIKLLPFFAVVFRHYGRASINPNLLRFPGGGAAGRTAKF